MKLYNKIHRWWIWRRYRNRFGWYARSAFLDRPELLVNPKGLRIDWGVRIRPHARLECIEHNGRLGVFEVGEATSIEFYFHGSAAGRVKIGQRVLIAGRVYISDHDHAMPWNTGKVIVRPVTIGDDCWLGEGCCILKGVELGEGCVVGANAVVTKSFPAGSIIAGVPARLIGTRELCAVENA
ncbi:MAG: acyltransferase [Phycisphaerae bacterium]